VDVARWIFGSSQNIFQENVVLPPLCSNPFVHFLIKNNTQNLVKMLKLKREKKRKEVMKQVKEKVKSMKLYSKQ